jgi:hypothetical protein
VLAVLQRRARVAAHRFVCEQRSTYSQALESLRCIGIRRSRGWLTKIINGYDCGPGCKGSKPEPAPAAPADPVAPAAHQRIGGLLTDQVRDG